jgi:hypothetical protein
MTLAQKPCGFGMRLGPARLDDARAPGNSSRSRRCGSCRRARCPHRLRALDKPAVQRKVAVGDGLRPEPESEDLLDIPAFLRRQAD